MCMLKLQEIIVFNCFQKDRRSNRIGGSSYYAAVFRRPFIPHALVLIMVVNTPLHRSRYDFIEYSKTYGG